MTIEKLPSGSYRIKQMHNKKLYSVTVPYKPTKYEAQQLITDKIGCGSSSTVLFKDACRKYIDIKKPVLSPASIRGYESLLRNIPDTLLNTRVSNIENSTVQKFINEYSSGHSPKSVSNMAGFVGAVLKMAAPNVRLTLTLPRRRNSVANNPTVEDVNKVLDYVKEHEPTYYVPMLLCCYGLRRSEVCALEYPSDLKGNILFISKSKVQDDDGEWFIKSTKTTASERAIPLPDKLVELIHEQGCFYEGFPDNIRRALKRSEKKVGVPDFTLHQLRHFFAAKMSTLTDEATVLKLGGWTQGSDVMKRVYRYSLTDEDRAKQLIEDMGII